MPFGTLNVYVEGAVNIKDTSIIGKGSPYCTVTCGQQAFNTQVVTEGGSCPFFNASLQFKIDRSTTELQITILSKNKLRDDDIVGYTTLLFKEVFFHSHSVPLTDYAVIRPTGRPQGQIRLSLTFHSQPMPKGYVERPGPPPQFNNFRPGVPSHIPRQSSAPPAAHPGASNPLGRQASQPGQPKRGYTPAYAQPRPQQYAPVQQPPYQQQQQQQQAPAYPPAPFTPRHQGPIGGPPPAQRRPATAAPAVKKSPKSSSSSSSESSDDEEDTPGPKNHRGPNRNPQPTAAARNGSGQTRGSTPNPNLPNQRVPRQQQQQQQYNGALAPAPGHQRGALPQQQQYNGALAPAPGHQRGALPQQQQYNGAPAPPPGHQRGALPQQQQYNGAPAPPPGHQRGALPQQQQYNGAPAPPPGYQRGAPPLPLANQVQQLLQPLQGLRTLPPKHRREAPAPRQPKGAANANGDAAQDGGNDTNAGANDGGAGKEDTSAADGGDGNDTNGGANDGGAGNGDTSAADGGDVGDGTDKSGGANDGGVGNGDTSAADGGDGNDTNGGANDGGAGYGDTSAADGADVSYNDYEYDYEYDYDYAEVVEGDGTVDPSQTYDTSEAVGYDPGYYQQPGQEDGWYQQDIYQGDQDYGYQQQDDSYQQGDYQQQDDSYQQDDYQQQDDSYQQDDYQQQDDSYEDIGTDFC